MRAPFPGVGMSMRTEKECPGDVKGILGARGKWTGVREGGDPPIPLWEACLLPLPGPPRSHPTLQNSLVPEPGAGGTGTWGRRWRQNQHSRVASTAQAGLREGEAPGEESAARPGASTPIWAAEPSCSPGPPPGGARPSLTSSPTQAARRTGGQQPPATAPAGSPRGGRPAPSSRRVSLLP